MRGVAAGARAARRGLRASDALRPLEARRTVAGRASTVRPARRATYGRTRATLLLGDALSTRCYGPTGLSINR